MRAVISAIAGGCVLGGWLAASSAQAPDYARAKELYDQATAELGDARYEDAARDFGAAYEITRDPVLFFKIASANEKAGRCGVAVIYYRRYLGEAKPEARFVAVTEERIAACGGTISPAGTGGAGSHPEPGAGSGSATAAGSSAPPLTVVDAGSGSGNAAPAVTTTPAVLHPSASKNGAWLLVGGALASITIGAVLAYSAKSSEDDIKDLYVSITNVPPTYDATVAKRYQDLVDEGHRYQYLSWASFGVAAGCAVGATILFVRSSHQAETVTVTPVATTHEAGVAATVRF